MTTTSVLEFATRERGARVVFGEPCQRGRSACGDTLLFPPGCVVAYHIRVRRYSAGCVFRTATSEVDHGGDPVPGVCPAPYLLFGFARGRRFDRALALLRDLGRRADAVSNDAYLRAVVSLGRPHLDVSALVNALVQGASWTC